MVYSRDASLTRRCSSPEAGTRRSDNFPRRSWFLGNQKKIQKPATDLTLIRELVSSLRSLSKLLQLRQCSIENVRVSGVGRSGVGVLPKRIETGKRCESVSARPRERRETVYSLPSSREGAYC